MKTFKQMKGFTRGVLDAHGMRDVQIHPGPELPDVPDRYVVWTPYGGPGLELEGVLDARSWQARVVGRQMDYDSAEEVAIVLDEALISHHSSRVGGLWVPEIQRVGGAPTALLTDDADRTHFVCSYIVSVEMALPN